MTIGFVQNSSNISHFLAFVEEHPFTYQAIFYNSMTDLLEAFYQENSQLDAMCTSIIRKPMEDTILANLNSKFYYVMVREEDTKTLSNINTALEQMTKNNPNLVDELYQKFYANQQDTNLQLTQVEQEYIKNMQDNNIVLEALIHPDRAPFSYREDGEWKGILTDICKQIIDKTGLQIQLIDINTHNEFLEVREQGNIPLWLDTRDDNNFAEKQGYRITDAYYSTNKIGRAHV